MGQKARFLPKPVVFIVLALVLLIPISASNRNSSVSLYPLSLVYSVEQVSAGEAIEYRFKLDDRHFGTLIDQAGSHAFRPHPGCDLNVWGSTWYAQPILPGAVLKHTTIESIEADWSGIHVLAAGKVSQGANESYGDWSTAIDFAYHPARQTVYASGPYMITLAGQLDETTGDLNLFKIASNYLDNVPLLTGGTGDTGDMHAALISKQPGVTWFTWIPPDKPSHFPTDESAFLSMDVLGELNQVDTGKQGYAPITPAFKPGLKMTLSSLQPEAGMTFGGWYDLAESQHFWADNVGITPLIRQPSTLTEFQFELAFESAALESCAYLPFTIR